MHSDQYVWGWYGVLAMGLLVVLSGCHRHITFRDSERPGMVLFSYGSIRTTTDERIPIRPYLLDRYEVTVADYLACVRAGICSTSNRTGAHCNASRPGHHRHPMNCISWEQADTYCRGMGKRLPSGLEWEWAAQGQSSRLYPWGQDAPSCRFVSYQGKGSKAGCNRNDSWPTGSFPAGKTPQGLFDMAGNVSEWVSDCADPFKGKQAKSIAFLAANQGKVRVCQQRVVHGGSWQSSGLQLQNWSAEILPAQVGSPLVGFRCAADVGLPNLQHVPEYDVTIPNAWIAPTDANGDSWDSVGAPSRLKLQQLQRQFQEKTKDLTNRHCWWDTNNRWTCVPAVKGVTTLIVLMGAVVGLYKLMDALLNNKIHRPDPIVEVFANGQSITFSERSNTYAPSWKQPKPLRIKQGDFLFVRISDVDPFGAVKPITQFRMRFQPSQTAIHRGIFRFIHNKDAFIKEFTLEFRRIQRRPSPHGK